MVSWFISPNRHSFELWFWICNSRNFILSSYRVIKLFLVLHNFYWSARHLTSYRSSSFLFLIKNRFLYKVHLSECQFSNVSFFRFYTAQQVLNWTDCCFKRLRRCCRLRMSNIKTTGGIPCKGSGRNLWTMDLIDSPNCASWPGTPLSKSTGLGCP